MLTHCAIIVTRNRPDDVARLLRNLSAQTRPPGHILVIDASDDGRVPASDDGRVPASAGSGPVGLPQSPPPPIPPPPIPPLRASLHRSAHNGTTVTVVSAQPGMCAQRNLALDLAAADIVSFFDDDVVLEEEYCRVVLERFEGDVTGRVAGIAGVITNPRETRGLERAFRRIFLLQTGTGVPRIAASGIPCMGYDCGCPTPIPIAATGAVSYRRAAVGELRFDDSALGAAALGFDSARVFGEDLLFSMMVRERARLEARGEGMLEMLPEARLAHYPSARTRESTFITQALYVRSLRVLSRRCARGARGGIARRWALAGQGILCLLQSAAYRDSGYIRGWFRAMSSPM